MILDVVVLHRMSTDVVGTFRYAPDSGETSLPDLALKIHKLAWEQLHNGIDVFLILRGSLREDVYKWRTLEQIIGQLRAHVWGGSIYVVWHQADKQKFEGVYNTKRDFFEEWICMLDRSGIADIIEISVKMRAEESDELKILSDSAADSQKRRRRLQTCVNPNGWVAVLRHESRFLEDILARLSARGIVPVQSENEVIYYDGLLKGGLSELRKKSRLYKRIGEKLVTAIHSFGEEDLFAFWQSKPIYFDGTFEWLFSFLRINRAFRRLAGDPPASSGGQHVGWVEEKESMRLRRTPNDGPLRLLITSSFHPNDEHDCIKAAEQIGSYLREVGVDVELEVHPSVVCERLPDLFEKHPYTVWLHITHGDRVLGLHEAVRFPNPRAPGKSHVSAERLLACFNAYKGSLQLAILSVCESTAIAEALAEAGIRIAIGFEKKVFIEAVGKLAERVVPIALQPGDNQQAILDAFDDACRYLSSLSYADKDGNPVYYSDAIPKAFAVQAKSS